MISMEFFTLYITIKYSRFMIFLGLLCPEKCFSLSYSVKWADFAHNFLFYLFAYYGNSAATSWSLKT